MVISLEDCPCAHLELSYRTARQFPSTVNTINWPLSLGGKVEFAIFFAKKSQHRERDKENQQGTIVMNAQNLTPISDSRDLRLRCVAMN
jgi:hypothetical protein